MGMSVGCVGVEDANVGEGVDEATATVGVGAVCTWDMRVAGMGVGRGCTSGAAVGSMETVVAIVGGGVDEGAVGSRAVCTRGCGYAWVVGVGCGLSVDSGEGSAVGRGGYRMGRRPSPRVVTVTDAAKMRGPPAVTL